MNKTLSILFGGALLCVFSAESCATNQARPDPVQIAIKALNLPGSDEYMQGKKPQLCILCANPTQTRWKGKIEELSQNYDLTFIDLGENEVGTDSAKSFDELMSDMGFKLHECYSFLPKYGFGSYDGSDAAIKVKQCASAFKYKTKQYLGCYKKAGSNIVVIRCNLASKVFQKYVGEHLTNEFDAIIQDSSVLCAGVLPGETMASLMASLKNTGVFISSEYTLDILKLYDNYEKSQKEEVLINAKIEDLRSKSNQLGNRLEIEDWEREKRDVIESRCMQNFWLSTIDDAQSYSQWTRVENNGKWHIKGPQHDFKPKTYDESDTTFAGHWRINRNYTAICEIDGDLAKHLIGHILMDSDLYKPYTKSRIMVAKFYPAPSKTISRNYSPPSINDACSDDSYDQLSEEEDSDTDSKYDQLSEEEDSDTDSKYDQLSEEEDSDTDSKEETQK